MHWEEKPVKLRKISSTDKRTLQVTVPAHLVRKLNLLDGELLKPEVTKAGDILYKRLTRFK